MEGYIGEIRGFAGNFCPSSWAYCQGQTIQIAANTALFSILGTSFGGNGQTTFMLPDLRGRVPVGIGQASNPGEYWNLGEAIGVEKTTIGVASMPSHNHPASTSSMSVTGTAAGNVAQKCCTEEGDQGSAVNNCPASRANGYASPADSTGTMAPIAANLQVSGSVTGSITLSTIGNGQPVNNIQPSLGIGWVICLYGMYPTRD